MLTKTASNVFQIWVRFRILNWVSNLKKNEKFKTDHLQPNKVIS
jgi:hypothetical protein